MRRQGFGAKSGGFLLVGFLPLLCAALVFFFRTVQLRWSSQNQIAARYRLQVCALENSERRRTFYRDLRRLNELMRPLQKVVYAFRLAQTLPGIGAISPLTEKAALAQLNALAKMRKLRTNSLWIYESKTHFCSPSPFSKSLANCTWRRFNFADLEEQATLFPDVPALVEIGRSARHLQVRCRILSGDLVHLQESAYWNSAEGLSREIPPSSFMRPGINNAR